MRLNAEDAKLLDLREGVVRIDTVQQRLTYLMRIYGDPPEGNYRYAPADRDEVLFALQLFANLQLDMDDIPAYEPRRVDLYCGTGYVGNDQVVGTQKECYARGRRVGDKHGTPTFR